MLKSINKYSYQLIVIYLLNFRSQFTCLLYQLADLQKLECLFRNQNSILMLITTYLKIKALGLLVLTIIYVLLLFKEPLFSLGLLKFLLIQSSKWDHELIIRKLVLSLKGSLGYLDNNVFGWTIIFFPFYHALCYHLSNKAKSQCLSSIDKT